MGFICVIVGIDDQLAFNRDGLADLVIKIEPATESTDSGLTWIGKHIGCPDRGHTHRPIVLALDHLQFLSPRQLCLPALI